MSVRFRNPRATPPGGCYEYTLQGETVSSRNRYDACRQVRDLRARHGLPTAGDGMSYLMEQMCPQLPDGFCTKPSQVRYVKAQDVKANTARLFAMRLAAADDIERRMEACVACPRQTRQGFCVDCTGLLDWIYRGFGGRRGKLPADRALGVCLIDEVLAAAGASVAGLPLKPGAAYPAECWRRAAAEPEVNDGPEQA